MSEYLEVPCKLFRKKKKLYFFTGFWIEKTDVPEIELVSWAQTSPVKKYGTFAVG